MADSCQQAVEDINRRCVQIEKEKLELEEQLIVLQHRVGSGGGGGGGGEEEEDTSSEASLTMLPMSSSDDVKIDMWRLQQENVQLRQRIYNQLASRSTNDRSQPDDWSDESSSSSVHTVIFTGKEPAERDPSSTSSSSHSLTRVSAFSECREMAEHGRGSKDTEVSDHLSPTVKRIMIVTR